MKQNHPSIGDSVLIKRAPGIPFGLQNKWVNVHGLNGEKITVYEKTAKYDPNKRHVISMSDVSLIARRRSL